MLLLSGCARIAPAIAEAAQRNVASGAQAQPDAPNEGSIDIVAPEKSAPVTGADSLALKPVIGGYVFSHNGTDVALGGLASDFIESAGEPDKIFEAPSCAFVGVDKILYYPGFTVNTFPVDGIDYILAVVFTDDSVATPEGVCLGMTRSDVVSAYGVPSEKEENGATYVKDGMSLRFVFENEVAVGLKYYYDDSIEYGV
jgi:hypothetical protein